jgi:hypothetical protein
VLFLFGVGKIWEKSSAIRVNPIHTRIDSRQHSPMSPKMRNVREKPTKTVEPVLFASPELLRVLSSFPKDSNLLHVDQELLAKFLVILGRAEDALDFEKAVKEYTADLQTSNTNDGANYFQELEQSEDIAFLRNEALGSYISCRVLMRQLERLSGIFAIYHPTVIAIQKEVFGNTGGALDIGLKLRKQLDSTKEQVRSFLEARSRGGTSRTIGYRRQEASAREWLEQNYVNCRSMSDAARKLIQHRIVSVTEKTVYGWVRDWAKNLPSTS